MNRANLRGCQNLLATLLEARETLLSDRSILTINSINWTVMDIRSKLSCSLVRMDRNWSFIFKRNPVIFLFAVPVFIASIFNLVCLPPFQRANLGPTCPSWACLHFNDITLVPVFRHPYLSCAYRRIWGAGLIAKASLFGTYTIGIMAGCPIRLPYILSESLYLETDHFFTSRYSFDKDRRDIAQNSALFLGRSDYFLKTISK